APDTPGAWGRVAPTGPEPRGMGPAAPRSEERSRFMEPVASGKKPLSPAKKKWLILAAVAAALVLFALWYTRPRSWAEVAGQRAFTSLNAQYQEITAEAGGTAFHVWELEIREPGEEAMEALMSALRAGRYRATLGNLWRSGERFSGNSQEIVYLSGA